MDDAVTVAVNPENPELVVQQDACTSGIDTLLFERAGDLRLEGVTDVDTERGVPVGIDVAAVVDPGNAGTVAGAALPPVEDEQ